MSVCWFCHEAAHIIYFTSITQKAYRTKRYVLDVADVGVLRANLVEGTEVSGDNHRPWRLITQPQVDSGNRTHFAAVTSEDFKPALSRSLLFLVSIDKVSFATFYWYRSDDLNIMRFP